MRVLGQSAAYCWGTLGSHAWKPKAVVLLCYARIAFGRANRIFSWHLNVWQITRESFKQKCLFN